jgi:hypothetical protein
MDISLGPEKKMAFFGVVKNNNYLCAKFLKKYAQ